MLRRLYSSSPASGPLKLYLFSLVCSTYNFEQQRASVALCFLLACVIQCPLLFTSCLELIVLSFTRSPVPAPAPTAPVPCELCIVPHAGAFYHACCARAFAFCTYRSGTDSGRQLIMLFSPLVYSSYTSEQPLCLLPCAFWNSNFCLLS